MLVGLANRSVTFAREAAVVAADTGFRGLELRRVGESLGGGSLITAVKLWFVST